MFKQGNNIEIKTKTELFKGVFVKEENDFVVLKLSNGYNIGILKKNIVEQKVIDNKKQKDKEEKSIEKQNISLPKISLLHTGGTIASKVDYNTGAVVAKFTPEEIISLFPELKNIANINSVLISNIMSENIRFSDYNKIGEAITEEIKSGAKGIIVTHGTDTLHYTAAALSFMLENINIPIILVGSQRSSDRPSSDASMNLLSAALFIVNTKIQGVFVCMHESMNDNNCTIIKGVNSRKMHTSRRDAFKAINKGTIARVDFIDKKVELLTDKKNNNQPEKKLHLKKFDEKIKIAFLKSHPNMQAEEIKCFENFDGVVIEGTGLGHLPINDSNDSKEKENSKIKEELKKLCKKMPVVMSAQTIYGRINMNVYSTGRELLELGIIGNYCDMTPETAFIKLAWLISNCKKEGKEQIKEIKELFETNLRGEISERSEKEGF